MLGMFDVRTHFGEDLHAGWPWSMEGDAEAPPRPGEDRTLLNSQMLKALPFSGVRLLNGFGISLGLGLILGLVMWRLEFIDTLLGPRFLGLQTLPSVCWVPLAILTFGITETGILFVLIRGSFFAVAIALRDGLRQIPPIDRSAALMLGARKHRLCRFAILPASLPALASSLRQGLSFAWRSLMGAELIFTVSQRGLGFLLNVGREFADVAPGRRGHHRHGLHRHVGGSVGLRADRAVGAQTIRPRGVRVTNRVRREGVAFTKLKPVVDTI
jgi:NitT/TauT family transport system permease protein